MVLLTMTPAMVAGLRRIQHETAEEADARAGVDTAEKTAEKTDKTTETTEEDEPDLAAPAVGKPIAHGQVLWLWRTLAGQAAGTTLEALLAGARVYVPPPPPKPEPTPEYRALMARLRRDEEARAYERMVRPGLDGPPVSATGTSAAAAAAAFRQANAPQTAADLGDDGVTLSDVNRQVMLIVNFVVTMAGVAYALWVLARWWATPARLFLAMGGSVLVGIAEYGLYAGYVWHLAEAAKKDAAAKPRDEGRAVVQSWVVGGGEGEEKSLSEGLPEGIPEGIPEDIPGGIPEGIPKGIRRRPEDGERRPREAAEATAGAAKADDTPGRRDVPVASGRDQARARRRK